MLRTILLLLCTPGLAGLCAVSRNLVGHVPSQEAYEIASGYIEPQIARRRFASCHRQSIYRQLLDQIEATRPATAAHEPLDPDPPPFEDVEELAAMLAHHGVDLTSWGAGTAKCVRDLYAEVMRGEATLVFAASGDEDVGEEGGHAPPRQHTPPGPTVQRVIDVVKVRITKLGTQEEALVEARQVFADGRERSRGLPLSEKMHACEDPIAAARRGILEELRSALPWGSGGVQLKPATLTTYEERRDSASYPSLPGVYRIHRVDAVVDLPDEAFSSIEYGGDTSLSDHILVHVWEWRSTAEVFDN